MTLSPYASRLARLLAHVIAVVCRLASALTFFLLVGSGFSFSQQQLSTPPFFKTSFDCSKAKWISIEEAICKNEKLARLDVEVAGAYRKRLDSTSASEKERVIIS